MGIIDTLIGNDGKDIYAAAPIPERLKKAEKILIITGDNTEDVEFFYPYYRLAEEGYYVDVATEDGGEFKGKHGTGLKNTLKLEGLSASSYTALYLPGGKAPSKLSKNDNVLKLVREFVQQGKVVSAICHGGQILAAADVIRGKRISGWPEIKDELEKAGAIFVDEALVEDGQFVTGRCPGDLHRQLYGTLQCLKGVSASERKTKAA